MFSLLVPLLSIVLGSGEPPSERPCVALGPDEHIAIDMREAPLSDVTRLMSCALDKNLLLQPATLGDKRVTVIGARPLDRRGLIALWRAMLADHGLIEERRGAYGLVRAAGGASP